METEQTPPEPSESDEDQARLTQMLKRLAEIWERTQLFDWAKRR